MNIEVKSPFADGNDSSANIRVELDKLNNKIKKSKAIVKQSQIDIKKLKELKSSDNSDNFALWYFLKQIF